MSLATAARGAAPDRVFDVIVVGGGMAGLSAANRLRDHDVLLLEADERLGGRLSSLPRDPYWLNLGAHLFGGPATPVGALIDAYQLRAEPVKGSLTAVALRGRLLQRGTPAAILTRLPLSAADRFAMLRSGLAVLRNTRAYQRFAAPREGESLSDLNRRLHEFMNDRTFGDLLGTLPPRVDALYRAISNRAQAPPERLAAGAALSAFALVFAKRNTLGRALIGGSSGLVESMARDHTAEVRLRARVDRVTQDDAGAVVTYTEGGTQTAARGRSVIVATPSHIAAEILSGIPGSTTSALREIRYGPSVVMAIMTNETRPMPWDGIYSAVVPGRSFNMFFNQANVLRSGESTRRPGGSLMIYASGALGEEMNQLSDQAIRERFLADLHEVFPDTRGIIGEIALRRWDYATAYAHVGRAALQPALEAPLGRIFLAGDYLGAWFTDSAILTAHKAAADARELLRSANAPLPSQDGAAPSGAAARSSSRHHN
jgi:protoporphyrinogen/coproporphyrinogen III oxidase